MNNYSILFFGTAEFATVVLDELAKKKIVSTLIVTAPDRPKGRGMKMASPPVKVWAQEHDIDVAQPENPGNAHFVAELQNSNWDLFVVAAYGSILSKELLNIPKHGTLNVHPSLLPKYRGSSPIQTQILADDSECGVSIMLLDEKMDHGPILAQASVSFEKDEWPVTADVLNDILWSAGGELLAETISKWIKGNITPFEQNHEKATYSKRLTKEDGEINLEDDSYKNYLKYCALSGWPGTYFFRDNTRVKITDAAFEDSEFVIKKIIPEGKHEMRYTDFLKG